ncbi:MAG: dockerin type I repeat-containing protein, partial [Oscillospiraceae bacterium]|nr:dockerin type I repeat-containing protein [Oscillospiraceae bacterium]
LSTKGDQSVGADLYNPYSETAMVYEETYDPAYVASRTSRVTTTAGTKLGTISFGGKFMNDDGYGSPQSSGISYSSSLSAYGKADGNSVTIGAKRYAGLQDISLTVENTNTNNSILLSKQEVEKTTLTFRGEAAEALAAKNTKLRDFSLGSDYLFSFRDRDAIAQELLSAQTQGELTTKQSHKNSITLPLTVGGSAGIKFKLGTTLSGSESYEYETSRGIYDNGMAYTNSVSDIREEVEANRLTLTGLCNLAAYEMEVLLSACWDDAKGFFSDVGDSIASGFASVKNATASAIEWTVGILSPKTAAESMQLLALGDRMTLFATPSAATTVGDPYVVYVEDANGEEITNFGDKPLTLSLGYSAEMLDAANVTGEDIAIYHWDDTINAYRRLGGTVDVQTQTVTTLIYEPGQYILAVDNCSPAITNFAASDNGSAPKLTAVISDMSGLRYLTFGIDGETIIDGTDFAAYYNRTTGSFIYRTEGLTAGVHTAFLIAEDSGGNRTAEPITLEFTVSTDAPTVGDVTYEKGEGFTAKAEVAGSDISLVVLTIEELTDNGAVQSAYVMQSAETGYTTTIPMPTEAFTARVIAYDSNGNAEATDPVKQYLIGDVNGDDTVTAKDITMLRRVLAGGYGVNTYKVVADATCDGVMNAKDVTFLRRHLAGGYGVELS